MRLTDNDLSGGTVLGWGNRSMMLPGGGNLINPHYDPGYTILSDDWRCEFCSSANHPGDDSYHRGKCPHCGGARGALGND